jgi:PknH-like extracellular domain
VQAVAAPSTSDQAPPSATTGLVLFPSATEANAFFTASSKAWAACADRQWTVPPERADDAEQRMQTKSLANANGVLSLTVIGNIVGQGVNITLTCQRALTVRNNLAIDITACGKDPGDTGVTIANQIGGRADKQ